MKKYAVLFIILILGAFLRLWDISNIPNALTWDEAANGYNAYSILKTARDEHGAFLPLVFKSFGDYKPGSYIYLTVPSIAIFGLNEFGTRFPSALAGIIAIFGVYLLVKKLMEDIKEMAPLSVFGFEVGVWDFAAFSLAISPWHVHFSRGAWETNVFSTLLIFTIYYLLRFIKGQSAIYPSLIFACLSLNMYQAAKMLTPLVVLLFITIYWHNFWKNLLPYLQSKKIIFILPFVIFGVWIYFGSFFGTAGNRLTRLSIFNYKPSITEETKAIDNQDQISLGLFHNQTQLMVELVARRYLYYFTPEVLFYEGSITSGMGHIPGSGMLIPLEFIWLFIGFVWLVKNLHLKQSPFIIFLLLLAPIPASLTLAEFSTIRALFMTTPLAIISGIGIFYGIKKIKLFISPVILVYLLLVMYTFDLYFFHSDIVFSKEFLYGYKQVVQIIKDNPTKRVVFTDAYGQPYIFYLFYTKFDPSIYQKNDRFIDGGMDVGRVDQLGHIEFHGFNSSDVMTQKDTLFIGTLGNINTQFDITGPNVALFDQFSTPDNIVIFRVIKTKP